MSLRPLVRSSNGLVAALVLATLAGFSPTAEAATSDDPLPLMRLDLEGSRLSWGSTGEWELANDSFQGNPFDVLATVSFTHLESGETVTTEMFYAGEDAWRFRFAATRLGEWRFESKSDDRELDGHRGTLTVVEGDPAAQGFLKADGNKLVVATDNGSSRRGVIYNVYVASQEVIQSVGDLPTEPGELVERVDMLLDETAYNGFNAFYVPVNNNWFSFGARSYEEHDSENPDLVTFGALETLILMAHQRQMFVHIWSWGDERRRWTPVGVGGINGEADRRLQRYIAARLSPLPGWTMGYGFDLEEWVEPQKVRSWASFLRERSGWPHLLMAREFGEYEGNSFTLGESRLDIFSTDDRPESDFYALAVKRLEEGLPVLFERRFVYGRDGIWDADTTRRAMWQFAMAGGAGSVWGMMFDDPVPYPHPEQFRIHRQFWLKRFQPDLQPVTAVPAGHALATPDGALFIAYQEDTERVLLDLSSLGVERRAVAVDAKGEDYREIDLGELPPGELAWEAPYRSDWAVAVGDGER